MSGSSKKRRRKKRSHRVDFDIVEAAAVGIPMFRLLIPLVSQKEQFAPFANESIPRTFPKTPVVGSKRLNTEILKIVDDFFTLQETPEPTVDSPSPDSGATPSSRSRPFAYSSSAAAAAAAAASSSTDAVSEGGPDEDSSTPSTVGLEQELMLYDGFPEYRKLVHRFFEIIKKRNPSLAGQRGKQLRMPPPKLGREPRKTVLVNFFGIADALNREKEHLFNFFTTELETQGSVDSNGRLVVKGSFYHRHFENVIRKYIEHYLQCRVCGGFDTELSRDSHTRLHTLTCSSCGATRTVTKTSRTRT